MKIASNPGIITLFSAVLIFNFSSCKYEDGPVLSLQTKKERLVGKWEVETMMGESQKGNDYTIVAEFEKDGDLSIGYIYEDANYYYGYFIKGEWEWEDGKSSLEVNIYGETYIGEIKRLTNKELVLDHVDGKWEFEKIEG